MRRIAAAAVALLVLPAAAMAEGMPQLNFNNPLTTTQVEWGAAIFVVLYILLSRLGLPQVASVLEERGTRIAGDLETAHAAKARADGAVSEMTETTAKARAEAQAAINAALEQAKAAAAKQAAVLNEKLEAQLKASGSQHRRRPQHGHGRAARGRDRDRHHRHLPPDRRCAGPAATRQRHRHGNRRPTRRLNESPPPCTRKTSSSSRAIGSQSPSSCSSCCSAASSGRRSPACLTGTAKSSASSWMRQRVCAKRPRPCCATQKPSATEALKEAQALIHGAQAEAARVSAAHAAEAEASAKRRERMAIDRIAAAEKAAVDQVRVTAADVATDAARQVISDGFGAEADARLIDHAISQVPSALRARRVA